MFKRKSKPVRVLSLGDEIQVNMLNTTYRLVLTDISVDRLDGASARFQDRSVLLSHTMWPGG